MRWGFNASSTGTRLLSLSTIADAKISNPPWVSFQSAGWVSFQSAPTALVGYKRTSGFDDLTRFYEATLGDETLKSLRHALKLRWPASDVGHAEPYVELRSRLRSYLTQYLLRKLVFEHEDTPALRDAFFAGDLGV